MLGFFIGTIWVLCAAVLAILVLIFGVFVTTWGHAALSSPHHTSRQTLHRLEQELQLLQELGKEGQKVHTPTRLPVLLGRTVDAQLQQLLDLVFRDLVTSVLAAHAYDTAPVIAEFKQHVWGAIQVLTERLAKLDVDKLIAIDGVARLTAHFEKIRIAQSCALELNQPPVFALSPHLMSSETELHYLRQVSELLLTVLFPRVYTLPPASHLFRELLACKVLKPTIDLITDPDYINQKIVDYLEAQKAADALHTRTHEYAKTFEDYIRLINNCDNVDTLKRLRFDIVAQMMQATTLQNMKRARGLDVDVVEKSAANANKQQIAAAKKLKRYISQLAFAKAECEAALRRLGWEGVFPNMESDCNKTLPLRSVLESVAGRRQLSLFLETMCSQGLVGFWLAAEELRSSPPAGQHQIAAEIFYTYIRSPSAEIKVDRETRKRMEAFLLGDSGPQVFFEVQERVVDTVLDKYYPSFLLSDQYRALLKQLADEADGKDVGGERSPLEERQLSNESASSGESGTGTGAGTAGVGEHSTYARRKLDQLQERHHNKTQALCALRASLKPESKALALLAEEVERLAGERRRLEAHLARTDTWAEHLGRWRATVHTAEVMEESKPVQFVVVVHMAQARGGGEAGGEDEEAITTGWVLVRTLPEFQELHRKLRPLCAELKNIELPSNSSFKFLFGKNDKASLEKAKTLIQKYLEFVLEDERLNQSEALYAFLNPSSEHLKHADHLPKKPRFSFSTLFKSTSGDAAPRWSQEREAAREPDDDEMSLYLDGDNAEPRNGGATLRGMSNGSSEERDGIAEPLYSLFGEVFDMRGVFKWLRRTLVTFVQITYGRTINRQIRETIAWMYSEQMLHYYISQVIKSWWPGGVFSTPPPEKTSEEKEEVRAAARRHVAAHVAGALGSLVGAAVAERGARKLFHTFQSARHNKQLLYELFELVLVEVFPELKKYQYL